MPATRVPSWTRIASPPWHASARARRAAMSPASRSADWPGRGHAPSPCAAPGGRLRRSYRKRSSFERRPACRRSPRSSRSGSGMSGLILLAHSAFPARSLQALVGVCPFALTERSLPWAAVAAVGSAARTFHFTRPAQGRFVRPGARRIGGGSMANEQQTGGKLERRRARSRKASAT